MSKMSMLDFGRLANSILKLSERDWLKLRLLRDEQDAAAKAKGNGTKVEEAQP